MTSQGEALGWVHPRAPKGRSMPARGVALGEGAYPNPR